jgi:hypothetical protein
MAAEAAAPEAQALYAPFRRTTLGADPLPWRSELTDVAAADARAWKRAGSPPLYTRERVCQIAPPGSLADTVGDLPSLSGGSAWAATIAGFVQGASLRPRGRHRAGRRTG